MRIGDERRGSPAEAPAADPAGSQLPHPAAESGPCLSEEEVLAFSEGSLMPGQLESVHAHLDDCLTCLELLNAAVHQWDAPPPAPGADDRNWMATFGAGQVIASRYQIERFIGRGGMGEVYLAFDRVLSERVALKTLLSTISDNPRAVERLLSEARLARRISHPNVCRVHDVGVHQESGRVDERLHFLTMEYIDGKRLGQLLRAAPMPISTLIDIARQILIGLRAAHAAGVLHRDLKSDNIMVSGPPEDMRLAIMDFGLSQVLGGESAPHRFGHERVGSISYMAPEQILGLELSPATDLFAFGVVLYEMACRQLPFAGHGASQHAALHRLAQKVVLPSQLRPDIAPGLERLILRCLMERPEDRCASAEQALLMLEEAAGSARPSAIYPTVRSCSGAADIDPMESSRITQVSTAQRANG